MEIRKKLLYVLAVFALACASLITATRHMSQSVWYDESQTNLIAHQNTAAGITRFARTVRENPPFFFFAVHESLRFRDDETGLRMPSALFGALAIFAVFFVGCEVADDVTGLIAALLFVVTPGAFRYFVDANCYTLLMLASAGSTMYLLKAIRSDSLRDWLLYSLFVVLGLGTHLLFMFHLGAQFVAGVYLRASARPASSHSYRRLLGVMAVLMAAALAGLFIYVHGGGQVRAIEFGVLARPEMLVTMAGMYVGPLAMGGLIALILWCSLQLLGIVALLWRHRRLFYALAILVGVPILTITLFIRSTLTYVAYRYGLGIFPLACVIAAFSWKAVAQRPAAVRASLGAVILVYCALGALFIVRADQETFGYQDWRAASRYLSRFAAPGETVIVTPDFDLLPLTYYYKAGSVVVGSDDVPAEVAKAIAREPVWLVAGSFTNDNPLISKYTEWRGIRGEQYIDRLFADIGNRGLRVCQTGRFHRVTVFDVRSQPCPVAP